MGHPTGRQGLIKAPFAGTIYSTHFLKPLVFEHGRVAHAPKCVEKGLFSEVRGSNQPIRRSGVHTSAAWRCPFGIEMRQLRAIRCAIVDQGVATRNDPTTREILVHRTGPCYSSRSVVFSWRGADHDAWEACVP
jgi:hypothetical protein